VNDDDDDDDDDEKSRDVHETAMMVLAMISVPCVS
jgi:hypothetical protein